MSIWSAKPFSTTTFKEVASRNDRRSLGLIVLQVCADWLGVHLLPSMPGSLSGLGLGSVSGSMLDVERLWGQISALVSALVSSQIHSCGTGFDAAPDATVDATVDAAPDATVDAAPDATVDATVSTTIGAPAGLFFAIKPFGTNFSVNKLFRTQLVVRVIDRVQHYAIPSIRHEGNLDPSKPSGRCRFIPAHIG